MYRDLVYPISWFTIVYCTASFDVSSYLGFHLCPMFTPISVYAIANPIVATKE